MFWGDSLVSTRTKHWKDFRIDFKKISFQALRILQITFFLLETGTGYYIRARQGTVLFCRPVDVLTFHSILDWFHETEPRWLWYTCIAVGYVVQCEWLPDSLSNQYTFLPLPLRYIVYYICDTLKCWMCLVKVFFCGRSLFFWLNFNTDLNWYWKIQWLWHYKNFSSKLVETLSDVIAFMIW